MVFTFPNVTTSAVGFMLPQDKQKLNGLSSAPLRPLFIAAGAEYNDTDADIEKTAPWGETVTHKAGHYYLNGLGDITEYEMYVIYSTPHNALYPFAYAHLYNTRTLFWKNGTKTSFGSPISHDGLFFYNTKLETVGIGSSNDALYYTSSVGDLNGYFRLCSRLKHINIRLEVAYIKKLTRMFDGCAALETVFVNKLPCDVSFLDSPNISKESILYAISNAQPASAITITLHPDAYARLAEDADIVAALEAQPLVTLVSA